MSPIAGGRGRWTDLGPWPILSGRMEMEGDRTARVYIYRERVTRQSHLSLSYSLYLQVTAFCRVEFSVDGIDYVGEVAGKILYPNAL